MDKKIRILGIETSCDETAVAIVDSDKNILANELYSQVAEHEEFKGVVPEIAARLHMGKLEGLIETAFKKARLSLVDIDAIAVTAGPGLIGGLIVGLTYAKAMAFSLGKPLIAINHLEAHALTARLTNNIEFPYLLCLVSGGHTQIIDIAEFGRYKILGSTLDDAIGEAFDKVAKMLNLEYPGGPQIEKLAAFGKYSIKFPVPLINQKNCNFSLSGLKTAVRNYITKNKHITKEDVCSSFQHTILHVIQNRLLHAFEIFDQKYGNIHEKTLVVAGGVAANKFLKSNLTGFASSHGYNTIFPPAKLCTDNAAMVAWLGVEKFKKSEFADLKVAPKSKWSLEEV